MPKVLAADRTPSVLRALHLAFQDTGFDVYTSEDGVQALEILMRIEPDAVVLGLSLPGKDGYEIARFLKSGERYRDIPLILLSDAFDELDSGKLGDLPHDLLLTKPFDTEELVRTIRGLIGESGPPEGLPEEPEPLETPGTDFRPDPTPPPVPLDLEGRIQNAVRREMVSLERELEKRLFARLKAEREGMEGNGADGPSTEEEGET